MDNQTAKHILSAYRPNGADASDPRFSKALSQTRADPNLETWFQEEINTDTERSRIFRSIKGPEYGKRELLATISFDQERTSLTAKTRISKWWHVLSAAALITISTMLWLTMPNPFRNVEAEGIEKLARFAQSALPLDESTSDVSDLRLYLANHGAPSPKNLPQSIIEAAKLAGCKIFTDSDGRKISLICFEKDDKLVHLFVFDSSTLLDDAEFGEWITSHGWNVYAWRQGTQQLALATKMPTAEINALVAQI